MKNNKTFIIGLFLILVSTSSILLINYLNGKDIFKKSHSYHSTFDDVAGLSSSTPVYIKGFRVGNVKEINYGQLNGKLTVTYDIESDYKLPNDTKCEIYSSDLLGSKSLRLLLGDSNEYFHDGDTIPSQIELDLISSLTSQLMPMLDNVNSLSKSLGSLAEKLDTSLDQETLLSLQRSLREFEYITKDLSSFSSSINPENPTMSRIFTNIDSLSIKLNSTVDELTLGVQHLESVGSELSEAKLKETILSFNALLTELRNPNGSFGQFVTNDTIHNSINSLILEIDTLIKNIDEDPKKYLKFSVF